MQHSNVFYKWTKDGFEPVKNAVKVRNTVGLDLFRIGYDIYEGQTGLKAASGATRDELKNAVYKMETDSNLRERMDVAIKQNIDKIGLSPRYERPNEKYTDLFPPDNSTEKSILAPSFDGKKHFFTEVYNENGIGLYVLKTKTPLPYDLLFLLYEGWMLNVGNLYHKDEIIEKYTKEMPDFRQIMTDDLNASLANPIKWASPENATFLGRFDEAKAHNDVVREHRRAERAAEYQKQQQEEAAERKKEHDAYKESIFNAEQTVLNKGTIINDGIRGTSLILTLFRENGVDLPLKTQGWVKSSLHSIFYNESGDYWSFRFSGNESKSFGSCLDRLVITIEAKYDNLLDQDSQEIDEDNNMEL